MAMLQSGAIDTNEYQRSAVNAGPLSPGVYSLIVVRSEQKDTRDRTGVYLEVEFDVTSPEEFANRKFWDRFNVLNKSNEASRIGREQLGDLALACGIPLLEDDQDIVGREVLAEIFVEPAKPYTDRNGVQQPGQPSNRCGKYWPIGTDVEAARAAWREASKGATAQPAAAKPAGTQKFAGTARAGATPAPQQAAAPAAATPPWKRNKQ